jgi:hypothetical protein
VEEHKPSLRFVFGEQKQVCGGHGVPQEVRTKLLPRVLRGSASILATIPGVGLPTAPWALPHPGWIFKEGHQDQWDIVGVDKSSADTQRQVVEVATHEAEDADSRDCDLEVNGPCLLFQALLRIALGQRCSTRDCIIACVVFLSRTLDRSGSGTYRKGPSIQESQFSCAIVNKINQGVPGGLAGFEMVEQELEEIYQGGLVE